MEEILVKVSEILENLFGFRLAQLLVVFFLTSLVSEIFSVHQRFPRKETAINSSLAVVIAFISSWALVLILKLSGEPVSYGDAFLESLVLGSVTGLLYEPIRYVYAYILGKKLGVELDKRNILDVKEKGDE